MTELSPKHRLVVDYYIQGFNQKEACKRAGFSPLSAKDIFSMEAVTKEIERRVSKAERTTDKNREWLCEKLEAILEAEEPIEVDRFGRTALNFNKFRDDLKKVVGKIVITETNRKVKYGGVERETKYYSVTPADKIQAAKELAILRGWREEKSKIDFNEEIVNLVNERRQQLQNKENE